VFDLNRGTIEHFWHSVHSLGHLARGEAMTARELLTYLQQHNVKLWAEGDRLRFAAPPGGLPTDLRVELVKHKAAILAILHAAEHNATARTIPPIRRRATPAAPAPLSFAQQRLWFLDQFQPNNPAYHIPFALYLRGSLDLPALERSLAVIVARHELLRTSFPLIDGQPQQQIAPEQSCRIATVDLRQLRSAEREHEARRVVAAEAQRPFDLAQSPLLRVTLLRIAPQEHILILVLHHIIFDGWSTQILIRELSVLYTACQHGTEDLATVLPPLPLQYADYALWQRDWLQGAALERQLDYWRRQLAGMPPVLELPTDYPRPAVQRFRGATLAFTLEAELSERLRALSQATGATLFMTLLAAFQTLILRYTQQTDVVLGTPIAGRNRAELEGMIGCFINTLVLRGDLTGQPSFRALLQRTRATTLAAYAHQDLPFERLVEELHPERTLVHTPLVQVLFDLHPASPTELSLPGLTMQPLASETGNVKFDLSLVIDESGNTLSGTIQYSSDLFTEATIQRMAGHYRRLLEGIVADPDQPITLLPLLTEAELHQLMITRNATATAYPAAMCTHELFAAQAAHTPDAVALIFEDQRLSYRDLDRRANQLARFLQQHGVGPQVTVGICMERAPDLVVGLLGILKAGGAFMPLDSMFPQERMAFMLEDARVALLLTQERLRERLPASEARLICLDSDWELIAQEPETPPHSAVTAQNLAYVIYTSGSTGRPKGVMIPHQGLVNYLVWCAEAYTAAAGRGAPVQSSIAADAIFPSLFAPLLVGTSVILLPESQALASLSDALQREGGFSLIKITPSQLEVLNQQMPDVDASGWVRTLVIGAEALRGEILPFWQTHAPETVLLNEYGPTETVVGCSIYRIPPGRSILGAVPIGLPIANTQFYVLDPHLQIVPVGVPGELYIGGAGVAWGYLNRPDLTAEKFIPNPFAHLEGAQPGTRLYKTGDLVRYLADDEANIEFLDRTDDQIKIRGFRIEPGEIETVLSQYPAVRESAVIAREIAPAGTVATKQLVAYIVPRHKDGIDMDELRSYLKQQLPEYMVPAALVPIEALPLAPHGKLDRKALPAPDIHRAAARTDRVAPRDRWEAQLVQIWEQLLGIHPIGVTEDFFALGGHSLLAVRLIARIEQAFNRSLSLTALFQAPTIAQLAARLRDHTAQQPWSPLVALQSQGTQPPFFCVHPGGGTVLCYAELAQRLGPDQPLYGLQARGLEPGQTPHADIPSMAREYLHAIRSIQPEGPYLLGGWSLGGVVAFEIARQLEQQQQAIELLLLIDSGLPGPDAPSPDDALLLAGFAHDLSALFGQALTLTPDELRQHAPDQQLDYVLAQLRQHQVVPPEIDTEQLRRAARLFMANTCALQRYRPDSIAAGLLLLQAQESLRDEQRDPAQTWAQLARGGVTTHTLAGDHYSILQAPYVEAVARQLRKCLQQVSIDA
jgi:amino acid adenylation domain-containing protein